MCMSDKSRAAWPEAVADDGDASLLWFVARAVLYSKNCTKLQENHKFFNECPRQNADVIDQFRPRTRRLLREARELFNPLIHSVVRRTK
jgi:hypothetical protein